MLLDSADLALLASEKLIIVWHKSSAAWGYGKYVASLGKISDNIVVTFTIVLRLLSKIIRKVCRKIFEYACLCFHINMMK